MILLFLTKFYFTFSQFRTYGPNDHSKLFHGRIFLVIRYRLVKQEKNENEI